MAIRFTPDGKNLALGDGRRVVMYPLDFSAVQADPRTQLQEAEGSLGKELEGFQLKIADFPAARSLRNRAK